MENITKLKEVEAKFMETMKEKKIALHEKNAEIIPSIDARINSLKLIKSELIRENVIKYGANYQMTEEEEFEVLKQMAKDRKKNVDKYTKANRKELAEADAKELEIVKEFLPKEPSEDEIKEIIAKTIDSYLASKEDSYKPSMRDMGEIKKLVVETLPNVDGGLIKDIFLAKIS